MLFVNTECLKDALVGDNGTIQNMESVGNASLARFTTSETENNREAKGQYKYSVRQKLPKQNEARLEIVRPISDDDSCWCLRGSASHKVVSHCLPDRTRCENRSERKISVRSFPKNASFSNKSRFPDVNWGATGQAGRPSAGKENVHRFEQTHEQEDCELCYRTRSNKGYLRPASQIVSPINSYAQDALMHAMESLSQGCGRNHQSRNTNQGFWDIFPEHNQSPCDQSVSTTSPANRFYIRLLGPNKISRASENATQNSHSATVPRELFTSSRVRQWRELESFIARKELYSLEMDLQYITNTIKTIELEKNERDRKTRIAEQWRTICLALDRVFFLIYLVTLIFSMCLFHPNVMSSLDKTNA